MRGVDDGFDWIVFVEVGGFMIYAVGYWYDDYPQVFGIYSTEEKARKALREMRENNEQENFYSFHWEVIPYVLDKMDGLFIDNE